MPFELVFIIISVIAGLTVGIATAVSFIKQPYQSKGTKEAEASRSLERQTEALQRVRRGFQQFDRAALEIRHREEDLLHLLAEHPQKNEDFRRILQQHDVVLRRQIETLEKQEKELQNMIRTLQPIKKQSIQP